MAKTCLAKGTMARLLPSQTQRTIDQNDEPSLLFVDDKQTQRVISTLSSETAFALFRALNENAMTASEISDELDVSVQNVSYHLQNLQEAELVEVVDSCYSEKGREMDIYAVTSDPKVVVLSTKNNSTSLVQAFRRMAGAIGPPAIVIAFVGAVSRFFDGVFESTN